MRVRFGKRALSLRLPTQRVIVEGFSSGLSKQSSDMRSTLRCANRISNSDTRRKNLFRQPAWITTHLSNEPVTSLPGFWILCSFFETALRFGIWRPASDPATLEMWRGSMKTELLEKIVNSPVDRRKFLKRASATSLGVAAMTMMGGSVGKLHAATTYTDVDILNFALNLEYLEAEFYLKATWGTSLVNYGVITSSQETGPTTGGKMVSFTGANIAFVASGLRTDEVDHVKYLRSALGSAAAPKPAINLDALGYGFANVNDFMKLGRQFEDVGVSAYLGAAPLISSKTYLDAAARILATEAQHSGSMRLACIWYGVNSPAVDSMDIPPTESAPFDVDPSTGLSIPRTAAQVLNIVYGGGAHSGGFYPDGMNGTIK